MNPERSEQHNFDAELADVNSERNRAYAVGKIPEEAIKKHWENPDEAPLFRTEIRKAEVQTQIEVQGLTPKVLEKLIENIKASWDWEGDTEAMQETFEAFFEQRKLDHPGLLNVEYYVLTDTETKKPFAVTGVYTVDVQGGAGLATKDKLDTSKHHMVMSAGWTAVSPEYQGRGLGKYVFDWIEKLGKNRGAQFRAAETDDSEPEAAARAIYVKQGMNKDFHVKDYFGPDRDLYTYYTNVAGQEVEAYTPAETFAESNKQELLTLGRQIYSPERFEEFQAAVDLVLAHKPDEKVILPPKTFVERNQQGEVSCFAIMTPSIYENTMLGYWFGAKPGDSEAEHRLVSAMKSMSKENERDVLILSNDGEDQRLVNYAFGQAGPDGIPEVWVRGDETRFLFYTKKLNNTQI